MPKIGDALKKAVEVKPQDVEDKSRARASSPLMNANRRSIFQYLCMNPCSGIGHISSALKMSRSTITWHLEQLIKSGYVDYHLDNKKKYYCPSGLISKKSMIVFSLLNQPAILNIYRAILKEPGQDPKQLKDLAGISSSHTSEILKKMMDYGLISSIRDGRHVRYYPIEGFIEFIKEDISSQKEFFRKLIEKMNHEHLRPEIDELKGGGVMIIIKPPGQTARINIPYNPLESLIQTD